MSWLDRFWLDHAHAGDGAGVTLFLAARESSFGRGGAVVDANLAVAADEAGRTLRGTGETLSDKAAAMAAPDRRSSIPGG